MKLHSIEIPANRPELALRDHSRFKGVPAHRVDAISCGPRLDIIETTRRATRPIDKPESEMPYPTIQYFVAVLIVLLVLMGGYVVTILIR